MTVSDTTWISMKKKHSRIFLRALLCCRKKEMRREPEVLEAEEAHVGKWFDCRARVTSKELAPIHSVKIGILPLNVCSTSPRRDAGLGKSALMRIARLMNSLAKGLKRMVTKVQLLCWKLHHNWVAYLQDMEPPKSSSIFRKSSILRKPIRCVRFTEAVVRHANIRDQNPSLRMICPSDPHQRNPKAPKFEDRSQEETARQERCAREAAWKKYPKLKLSNLLFCLPCG